MSRPFAAVESFLERLLERPAARLFHAHPQPVQLERRIERAMSAMRVVASGQTYVPSRYRILLNPADHEALQEGDGDLAALLADAILVRAREQGHWLLRRPDVSLVPSPRVAQGDLEVDAEPLDPSLVSAAATGLRPVELEGPKAPRAPIPGTGVVDDEAVAQPSAVPATSSGHGLGSIGARAAIPVVAEADAPPPMLAFAPALRRHPSRGPITRPALPPAPAPVAGPSNCSRRCRRPPSATARGAARHHRGLPPRRQPVGGGVRRGRC
ncbi:MAG: DUF3662 domain-containing protein [Chloroflexota bacterium]